MNSILTVLLVFTIIVADILQLPRFVHYSGFCRISPSILIFNFLASTTTRKIR